MSEKPEWCLGSKTTGKRFSEVQTQTVDPERFGEFAKDIGRPNEKGGYVIGKSFDRLIEDWVAGAEALLKKANLPHTPKVFKVTDKPKSWVDSSDPEDIARAVEAYEMFKLLSPNASRSPPSLGKKLNPDIVVSWQTSAPPSDRFLGGLNLDLFIRRVGDGDIKAAGVSKKNLEKCKPDGLLDFAARIIVTIHQFKKAPSERKKIQLAFELGELRALVKVYGIESAGAGRAGKAPKKKDWATELASQLLEKTENFGKAWKLISDDRGHTDAPTVVRTVKEGKESVEHLEGAPPYQSLTKDSFRTEYFQPAKKILKNLKKSED